MCVCLRYLSVGFSALMFFVRPSVQNQAMGASGVQCGSGAKVCNWSAVRISSRCAWCSSRPTEHLRVCPDCSRRLLMFQWCACAIPACSCFLVEWPVVAAVAWKCRTANWRCDVFLFSMHRSGPSCQTFSRSWHGPLYGQAVGTATSARTSSHRVSVARSIPGNPLSAPAHKPGGLDLRQCLCTMFLLMFAHQRSVHTSTVLKEH